MTTTLNVLGFSHCGLPGCDCGARIVLGLTRDAARHLREVLRREFTLEQVAIVDDGRCADGEPFTATARRDFDRYAEEAR